MSKLTTNLFCASQKCVAVSLYCQTVFIFILTACIHANVFNSYAHINVVCVYILWMSSAIKLEEHRKWWCMFRWPTIFLDSSSVVHYARIQKSCFSSFYLVNLQSHVAKRRSGSAGPIKILKIARARVWVSPRQIERKGSLMRYSMINDMLGFIKLNYTHRWIMRRRRRWFQR